MVKFIVVAKIWMIQLLMGGTLADIEADGGAGWIDEDDCERVGRTVMVVDGLIGGGGVLLFVVR